METNVTSFTEQVVPTREAVRQRLATEQQMAAEPTTVFCVVPFESLSNGGNERLGNLMSRVVADPEGSLVVATREAFVFAFGGQTARRVVCAASG